MQYKFDSIESALSDIRAGKIVIVVDDENRENEGDFIMAAEKVTPEAINFMITHGKGLVCAPITHQKASELDLNLMVEDCNNSKYKTPFTVSIDLKQGNTTGISCHDRYRTLKALTKPDIKSHDFTKPGHIFPLIAKEGGVLEREGHTEATIDLMKLSDLYPAGVICEILNPDGTMARLPQLIQMAEKYDLRIISIKDLIEHIKNEKKNEDFILQSQIPFPCKYGEFSLKMYGKKNSSQNDFHFALVKGDITTEEPVLLRMHSECFTGDLFGSQRCDCGDQLKESLQLIEREGRGILIYLKQEGRGIGAINKIKAYELQDKGYDTVSANHGLGLGSDLRDYNVAVQILKDLEVKSVDLLTNNPQKIEGLEQHGINIHKRISLEVPPNTVNLHYLETKRDKMGHLILNKTLH